MDKLREQKSNLSLKGKQSQNFRNKCLFFKTIIKMTPYKTQVIYVLLLTFFSEIASGKNWQLVWSDEFTSEIVPDWVFETGL